MQMIMHVISRAVIHSQSSQSSHSINSSKQEPTSTRSKTFESSSSLSFWRFCVLASIRNSPPFWHRTMPSKSEKNIIIVIYSFKCIYEYIRMFMPMNICISMCMVNQVINMTNINNMTKYATLIAKKLHINFNLKRKTNY